MSRQLCPHHPAVDHRLHWGCPECVIDLRAENARLRTAMEKHLPEFKKMAAQVISPRNNYWSGVVSDLERALAKKELV